MVIFRYLFIFLCDPILCAMLLNGGDAEKLGNLPLQLPRGYRCLRRRLLHRA
jgi:hypothetical protein